MKRNPFSLILTLLALLLPAATYAQEPSGARSEARPTAVFRLPATGSAAGTEAREPLGPERELELRGLPGEVVLARLALSAAGSQAPEMRAVFEGEAPGWLRRASFLPGASSVGGLHTLWLTLAVPEDAAPGVYEGYLEVRAGDEPVRVPLIITISSGRLGPTAGRYLLLLTPAPKTSPTTPQLPPGRLPPTWPQRLPLTFVGLREADGEVTLDLSGLGPLREGFPPPGEPLPVLLGPLVDRLSRRFGLEPLSATYVLALHSLLSQLRDWAGERGLGLLFVPPAADPAEDPEALALAQHVTILRETPGIRVLLPVRPLLELKRSQQQALLSLAQAYLVEGPRGLALVAKRGVEGRPVWLLLSADQRLAAGFWARSVGAEGVLLNGDGGVEAALAALVAETDARYLDTLRQLVARAEAGAEPAAQRAARLASDLLQELSRRADALVADTRAAEQDPDQEATRWRERLRHEIETLTELLR